MPEYNSVAGLDVEVRDTVLRLTLDDPQRRNALTDASLHGLIETLTKAATDEGLRAIMITGAGENFCSGFDIVARNARNGAEKPRTGSIQRRLPTQANQLVPMLLDIQLPVVCAIRGWAVGIGAQLALVADFTVTATDAVFWYPFLRRGFTPDSGSTWLLPRIVGTVRARELLMLDRKLTGVEAGEWGIAHQVVESDAVDSVAWQLVSRLADGPTVALGLTKRLINSAAEQQLRAHLADEAFAMELSSRSPDFREGLRAFAERRSPTFEGR